MKVNLSAKVVVQKDRKATVVLIQIGSVLLASGKIGGAWNEAQALTEFQKNPKRFKTVHPDAELIVRAAA